MPDDNVSPFANATVTLAVSDFAPPTCRVTIANATCDPTISVRFTPESLSIYVPRGIPAPVRVTFVIASGTPFTFAGFYFPSTDAGNQFKVLTISPAQVVVNDLCNPAKMGLRYSFKGLIQNTETGAVATFDPFIETQDSEPPLATSA